MKNLHYLAVAIFALSASAYAQNDAAPAPASADSAFNTAGLIGKRYVEASFEYDDYKATKKDVYAPSLTLNLPLSPNFDVSVDYGHAVRQSWENLFDQADVTGTLYFTSDELKPFVAFSLGYVWGSQIEDECIYNFSAGFEYALTSKIALTAAFNAQDDFKSHTPAVYSLDAMGSYSLSKRLTASLGVIVWNNDHGVRLGKSGVGGKGVEVGLAYKF